VLRVNNGAVKIGNRFVRFTDAEGVADILGYLPGRLFAPPARHPVFCAVECKFGAGRLSKSQKAFLANVRADGGFAWCARSVSELDEALTAFLRGESYE